MFPGRSASTPLFSEERQLDDSTAISQALCGEPWHRPSEGSTECPARLRATLTKTAAPTETAISKAVRAAKTTKTHERLPDPGERGLRRSIGKSGMVRCEALMRVAVERGAPQWNGLGRYPDAGLAAARDRCDAVRVAVAFEAQPK
jgi:hypothetical protein